MADFFDTVDIIAIMLSSKNTRSAGFTIVELLIVIVIIAILAAISVVAFNGIQQRAQNTQRITAAKEWQKIVIAYTATKGVYANTAVPYQECLGTGYETTWDANADEDCGWTNNIKHPNAASNTAYATIASLPAYPKMRQTLNSSVSVAGISIRSADALDPNGANKTNYPMLLYWLEGNNQDCVLRPVVVGSGSGYVISQAAINTGNDGSLTQCRIALPDPVGL